MAGQELEALLASKFGNNQALRTQPTMLLISSSVILVKRPAR